MKRPESCELCGESGGSGGIYKHHIQYYPEACLFVCGSCHGKIHGDSYDHLEPECERPSNYTRSSPTGICPSCVCERGYQQSDRPLKPSPVCRAEDCNKQVSMWQHIRKEVKEWVACEYPYEQCRDE